MILEIPMRPFPAVRSNRNTWTSSIKEYHAKMNTLRTHLLPNRDEIIKHLIYGDYHIQFHFEMPKAWSKKKKIEMDGKPMQSRPDTDNLAKSFFDTLFYQQERNDCEIWNNSYSKHWGKEDKIIFIAD